MIPKPLTPRPAAARALMLVDLENLLGAPSADQDSVRATWQALTGHAIALTDDSHVVVACNPYFARDALFALPSWVQRRVRHGRDGADLALLDSVDVAHARRRFSRMVIASGDGAFAPLAEDAARAGMEVVVVSGAGAVARRLSRAARWHLRMHPRRARAHA